MATLVETDQGLKRDDFCIEAWEGGARPAGGAMIGFWRAVVPAATHKPRTLIDDGALLDLFEQLAEATEASRLAFRYVLALLLVRKRILRVEPSPRGTLVVRTAGENPSRYEVADPGLDETRLAEVTEQLGQVVEENGA